MRNDYSSDSVDSAEHLDRRANPPIFSVRFNISFLEFVRTCKFCYYVKRGVRPYYRNVPAARDESYRSPKDGVGRDARHAYRSGEASYADRAPLSISSIRIHLDPPCRRRPGALYETPRFWRVLGLKPSECAGCIAHCARFEIPKDRLRAGVSRSLRPSTTPARLQ